MVYRYYCLDLPPSEPGAVPKGMVGYEETTEDTYFPEIECTAWGFVDYTRRLTAEEVDQYMLCGPVVQPEIRASKR